MWLRAFVKAPFTGLLHAALVIIVIGACVTHFFGEQGEIHLRTDKAVSLHPFTPSSVHRSLYSLPYEGRAGDGSLSLFLWDFQVITDEQGNPVDYVSNLRILDRSRQPLTVDEGSLRMNKPLKYHGYRFCQSDYDSDLQGVVLAYNYDPWGIGITYTGYALLLIAMIAFFFQRRTRFRALLKSVTSGSLLLGRVGVGLLAVLIVILSVIMTRVVTPKPPLQPVLQTPLLGIHVSVIMLAYTLFAVIAVDGIVGLCMPRYRQQLMQLSQLLLYPALFCLTAGIFIGAVWANMSWGRYWGWDPKETWALITMLVYAALLHFPWLNRKPLLNSFTSSLLYHLCSVIAFFFVLFTYFGVSYLLGGLHSYE